MNVIWLFNEQERMVNIGVFNQSEQLKDHLIVGQSVHCVVSQEVGEVDTQILVI